MERAPQSGMLNFIHQLSSKRRTVGVLLALAGLIAPSALAQDSVPVPPPSKTLLGPLWQDFDLTLKPGVGRELLGPLYGQEQSGSTLTWRISPLFSKAHDPELDFDEAEFLYPLLTYDRFGSEWRFQIFQFFNWAGSQTVDEEVKKRYSFYPFYFQQISTDPTNNYLAVFPFYGHVKNRFFRDEARFIMLPLYVQTKRRGVVTDNYLLPIYHHRHGDGVDGWQVWPLLGHETRAVGQRTNVIDELVVVPGHDRKFLLWPFFFHEKSGLGTSRPLTNRFAFPLYLETRSPAYDYTWISAFSHTTNRVAQYEERYFPWPFFGRARGPGKTMNRYWPIIGHAERPNVRGSFLLWPLFTRREQYDTILYRRRDRIAFFLYNDLIQADKETGRAYRRKDLLPLYTWNQQPDGKTRLQVLAPLEPFLPNNKTVQRMYSPIWSVWRDERDPVAGKQSQSLLWNLWRREVTPETKRHSAVFGAWRSEKTDAGRSLRVLGIPIRRMPTEGGFSNPPPLKP